MCPTPYGYTTAKGGDRGLPQALETRRGQRLERMLHMGRVCLVPCMLDCGRSHRFIDGLCVRHRRAAPSCDASARSVGSGVEGALLAVDRLLRPLRRRAEHELGQPTQSHAHFGGDRFTTGGSMQGIAVMERLLVAKGIYAAASPKRSRTTSDPSARAGGVSQSSQETGDPCSLPGNPCVGRCSDHQGKPVNQPRCRTVRNLLKLSDLQLAQKIHGSKIRTEDDPVRESLLVSCAPICRACHWKFLCDRARRLRQRPVGGHRASGLPI